MARKKRAAENELNHLNWDQEDDDEDSVTPGKFAAASKEKLSERVIKTAKRRTTGAGGEQKSAGLFSGFTGFGQTSTTNKSTSDDMPKPPSMSGDATTTQTPTFKIPQISVSKPAAFTTSTPTGGGKRPINATTAPKSDGVASTFTTSGATSNNIWSKQTGTAAVKTEQPSSSSSKTANGTVAPAAGTAKRAKVNQAALKTEYLESVKALNEGVLAWAAGHVKQDPYVDLTPVFKDYFKHFAAVEQKYGVWENGSDRKDFKSEPGSSLIAPKREPADAPVITLGSSPVKSEPVESDVKPIMAKKSPKFEFDATTKPNLNFGGGAATGTGLFKFGSGDTSSNQSAKEPATTTKISSSSMFSGLSNSAAGTNKNSSVQQPVPELKSGFGISPKGPTSSADFLAKITASKSSNAGGFKIDSSATTSTNESNTTEKPMAMSANPLFRFGSSESTSSNPPSSTNDNEKSMAPPLAAGSWTKSDSNTETSSSSTSAHPFAFGFMKNTGANKDKNETSAATTQERPFSFAASVAAASASASSESTKDDDEPYVPPVVEDVEIKEDDAFYSVKCALHYMSDGAYAKRGVGMLYLKPLDNAKIQLLIRNTTALGSVLLNVRLNNTMRFKRESPTSISFCCVPNPPLPSTKDKEIDASKPVLMLIRVKLSEDADKLFEELKKA